MARPFSSEGESFVMPKKKDPQLALVPADTKNIGRVKKPRASTALSSYVVDMNTITQAELRGIGTGMFDSIEVNVDNVAVVMRRLAALRSLLWKLDRAWYTKRDAIDVQAFIAGGAKASDIAKALAGASLDPYWRKRDHITFQQVLTHFGGLIKRYDEHRAGRPKNDRNDMIEMLSRMMIEIEACAPFYLPRFKQMDTQRMSFEELRIAVDEARVIVAKYGRSTVQQ